MPATKAASTRKIATKTQAPKPRTDAGDFVAIFAELHGLLSKYAPPFEERSDAKGGYHLFSVKDIVVNGRKRSELHFASIIPQKGYIGFYYMPVYVDSDVKAMFKPELLALRKGQSCFYVKKQDPVVMKQIKTALADGFKMYKQRGWV